MKNSYIYLVLFLIIVIGIRSFLNYKNKDLKEIISKTEFKEKLKHTVNKKKINDLILDIEGWQVLDENNFKKFNIGSLFLFKKKDKKELNFSVLYQKHEIKDIVQYCRYNMLKELEEYKGLDLNFVNMYEVNYKEVKAIREEYTAYYKEPIEIEVITFKYKEFYYRITYVNHRQSRRLLSKINFI